LTVHLSIMPAPHKTHARKRPFGRYKLGCRDNIKINLTEIRFEVLGRIYLTVDRDKRLPVNIVISFGIPQKLGNIFLGFVNRASQYNLSN